MVLALADGFGLLDELTGETQVLALVGQDDPSSLMNDGKCDPAGRFWAGTLTDAPRRGASALYRLETDLSVTTVLEGVTISNGLGWSPERDRMYYVDTGEGGLDIFDYDETTGEIRGRRRLADVPSEVGVPDGLTVDAEGYVWLAIYGGSSVRRYSPEGGLDGVVALPVSQVTSCAFGGPNLEHLYVTTASEGFTPRKRVREPHAGGLFRCMPGVKGLPAYEFAG
jgi:sugar lactone lactonase YvrE